MIKLMAHDILPLRDCDNILMVRALFATTQ